VAAAAGAPLRRGLGFSDAIPFLGRLLRRGAQAKSRTSFFCVFRPQLSRPRRTPSRGNGSNGSGNGGLIAFYLLQANVDPNRDNTNVWGKNISPARPRRNGLGCIGRPSINAAVRRSGILGAPYASYDPGLGHSTIETRERDFGVTRSPASSCCSCGAGAPPAWRLWSSAATPASAFANTQP